MDQIAYLDHRLKDIGISCSNRQLQQFLSYYELLISWNRNMNLTTILAFEEVVEKHFVDSLLLASTLQKKPVPSMIDVGTGAGFPGLPIKIVFPSISVLLLDSLNKRITFLQTVIQELGLTQIEAIHGRAEELARTEAYREKFDLCVSRAVARLSSLSEFCLPFVRLGGTFVSYKASKTKEEVEEADAAIKVLGGKLIKLEEYKLLAGDVRSLVFFQKIKQTNAKYPRAGGKPLKDPIRSS